MSQPDAPRQLYVQTVKSILQYNAVRNPGATAFLLRDDNGEKVRVSYRKPARYFAAAAQSRRRTYCRHRQKQCELELCFPCCTLRRGCCGAD